MKPRIKKQVFSLVLALSLSFGMTEQTAKLTLAASNGADKLYSATAEKIDIYKKNKKPNARNYKADWNAGIFYTLEDINTKSSKDGQIKKYKLVRKELINKKNGNRIEYEVYKHPKTGKMHKITSIEHRKNDLEITDYYYDDKGKPNFVYQRKDSIYTPIYADFNRTGDRYFFNNDSLIKWRWVKKANDVEEITLKVDKGRKDVKQHGFSTVSKAKKKAYDKKEVNMLNAAYNTYKAMLKKTKMSIAKGYIVDAKRKPIANATVEFLRMGKVIGTVKTNAKGYYTTGILPVKEGYTLRVSADGYQTTEGAQAVIDKTGVIIWIANINLVAVSEASHKVSINVYDGENIKYSKKNIVKSSLSGAEVIARKGLNNKTGEQVIAGTTDANGNLVIELVNGVYTLEIRVNGYVTGYKTVVVDDDKNVTVAMTKPVKDNQMKVVLSWDGANDLDSYLFTPYKANKGNMAHIGGSVKKDKHGNSLYLDSKDGNGVEIINIANINNGYYKYYVSDYTNSLKKNYSAKDMAGLNIRVEVYDKNGLAAVYIIPYNPNGVIWEVFEIKNGKIVPLQNTYKNVKGKKWWVEKKKVYKTGEMVVPFKYDEVEDCNEGMMGVRINDKWGYVNSRGEEIIPIKYTYDSSMINDFYDGIAMVEVENENGIKFGYVNKQGKEIIPIKYDDVAPFSEGLACVGLDGKCGYVNKQGKEVIKIKYGYQLGYSRTADYPMLSDFNEGLACVQIGNKIGYINKKEEIVIPAKFDYGTRFKEGRAFVGIGDKYGYINKKGQFVGEMKYDRHYSNPEFYNGFASVTTNGNFVESWGIINKQGKEIVPTKYNQSSLGGFTEGFSGMEIGEKWGYIDENGKLVIPAKYDGVWGFYGGLSAVKIGNKYGYINKKGKMVIPAIYESAYSFEGGLANVKLGDKFGLINKKGEIVIPIKYEDSLWFKYGLAEVKIGNKFGCINKKGKLIIPIRYDGIVVGEKLIGVKLNDKWGFISR